MSGLTTVACKIPNGLVLRVFRQIEQHEPVMGGGTRPVKRAQMVGDPVKVHGPATPFGEAPKCLIVGGYAMTPNVDTEFFAKWLEQNADADAVKNNLIFASEKRGYVEGEAKTHEVALSGLEPISPGSDKRIPKGNRSVSGIETMKKD
jgi:hypothetical protein